MISKNTTPNIPFFRNLCIWFHKLSWLTIIPVATISIFCFKNDDSFEIQMLYVICRMVKMFIETSYNSLHLPFIIEIGIISTSKGHAEVFAEFLNFNSTIPKVEFRVKQIKKNSQSDTKKLLTFELASIFIRFYQISQRAGKPRKYSQCILKKVHNLFSQSFLQSQLFLCTVYLRFWFFFSRFVPRKKKGVFLLTLKKYISLIVSEMNLTWKSRFHALLL